MAYDLFISYASEDKTIADAVCARLESAGTRCWIAPRDITAGKSYGEAIIEAIREVKVMVLVFSSNANTSVHIPKEVERAVSKGVPIIPFRIENVTAGKSLDYFIGSVHWLDAMTPPLEKHLDDLVATIQKLFPATAGERGVPAPPPVPPPAPPIPVKPPAGGPNVPASSTNRTWIGIAAAAVIVAIVGAAMMLRGGGGSQGTAQFPGAGPEMPAPRSPAPVAPNPKIAPNPVPPSVRSTVDPVVGCYQWFNNAPVVIRADGTMVGGPFTAHWRVVDSAQRAYTFTWPEATDTVAISADQRSLSGGNQYGYPASGMRVAGSGGLAGIWRWANGVPVTVNPDGTFSAAAFKGKWHAVDASRGIYTLTWPNPVDSVTLSADGSRVSGANQYGVAISGARTEPCAAN